MGPIPIQRATVPEPVLGARWEAGAPPVAQITLDSDPAAPAEARRLVRAALAEWAGLGLLGACGFCGFPQGRAAEIGQQSQPGTAVGGAWCPPGRHSADLLADDAALIADELVTNAVVHAGTTVEMRCRIQDRSPAGLEGPDDEPAALLLEVSDHHPSRTPADPNLPQRQPESGTAEYGRGLQIVASLAECWGVTYRTGLKTVWARLALDGRDAAEAPVRPVPAQEALAEGVRHAVRDEAEWRGHGALAFLAETSDLLAGQLDEELVAALAGQLLVPRLADWCAVWLDGVGGGSGHGSGGGGAGGGSGTAPRPARVWHADESRLDRLRTALEENPPLPIHPVEPLHTGPVPVLWPSSAGPGPDNGGTEGYEGAGASGERGTGENAAASGERAAGAGERAAGPGEGGGSSGAASSGEEAAAGSGGGVALLCRLVTNGRQVGTLLLGRAGRSRVPDEVIALIEDFARRVALAIDAARRYTRQATISRVLQRGLLPSQVARIPGVVSGLVYEPSDEGLAGGDFYDVFHCPGDRWCFMLGDVQGSGPEAAVVTGLARPWLRLLGREGYNVGEVLDRLNRLLLDDATEAAEAASVLAAVSVAADAPAGMPAGMSAGGNGVPGVSGVPSVFEGSQPRFLSLLYGEFMPLPLGGKGAGARCTLASAGHPLPLLLRPDGTVRPAAEPQLLLGIAEHAPYEWQTFDLEPGDTLLCVTDGVTERRSGNRLLDDGDGLAEALAGCVGLSAEAVAERIRRAVHDFDGAPPDDDLALLVFQAE